MTVIELQELGDLSHIQSQKEAYLRSLVFPMDSYWESAVVGQAPHYQIVVNGQQAGYCAIRPDKRLVQFFVIDLFLPLASTLFSFIIKRDLVQSASAGTFEPAYLSHCLDHQHWVEVRSYLFEDYERVNPLLDGWPTALFRLASAADAENLAAFYGQNDEFEDTEAITTSFGSRLNYAKSLIEKKQVYVLLNDNELIGVGECQISNSQAPYADLGMITAKKHRRKGIGVYILAKLKQECYRLGAKPICSCAAANLPSQKTIEKAGFITRHRLLNIQF